MSISVNNNPGAISWETLLNQVQGTKAGEAGAVSETNRNLSFTVVENGQSRTVTVAIPDDLELPAEVTQGSIESLVAKLGDVSLTLSDEEISQLKDTIVKLYNEASAALGATQNSATTKSSVMFDLYKLMALLVEVAQKQRDAARELRSSENLMIQHSIQAQADQQRAAAMTGLIVGVTCGVVSAAVSIGVMVGQAKAYGNQMSAQKNSGLETAQTKISMLQKADSVAHADMQLNSAEAAVGAETANTIKADINAKVAEPKAEFEAAQTKLNDRQQALDKAKGETVQARNDVEAKMVAEQQAQTNVDNLRNELGIGEGVSAAEAKQTYLDSNQNPDQQVLAKYDQAIDAENTLAEAKTAHHQASDIASQKELAEQNARTSRNDAKRDFETARLNYRSALQNAADAYSAKFDAEVALRADGQANNVDAARNEMKMAHAYVNKELAVDNPNGLTTDADYKNDLSSARMEAQMAGKALESNEDYRGALRRIEVLTGVNAINTAVGGMLQSGTQSLFTMLQAESTRARSEEQEQQEMLDQTKDLFNQAQTNLNRAVELMAAVIAAENQSMRDAIQA